MVTSTGASNTGALYANTGIYTSGSTLVTGQMIAGTTGTTNYPVRSYTSNATTALGIVYEAVNSNVIVGSANIGFNVADAATEVSQPRQSFGVVRTGTYGVGDSVWCNSTGALSENAAEVVIADESMRLTSTGNLVLKGLPTNYAQQIQVNHTAAATAAGTYFIQFLVNNVGIGKIEQGASASTVAYQTSSDYRLKTNFSQLNNSIDQVMKLNPVNYVFKDAPNVPQIGFIAREVQKLYPTFVSGFKDETEVHCITCNYEESYCQCTQPCETSIRPKYQCMDYSKFTPLLTGAIQELVKEINILKTNDKKRSEEIDGLKAVIQSFVDSNLASELNSLEETVQSLLDKQNN